MVLVERGNKFSSYFNLGAKMYKKLLQFSRLRVGGCVYVCTNFWT